MPSTTPLVALVDGWVVIVNCVAGPAVIDTLFEVAPVRPVDANANVLVPIVPVMERFVNVATPLAFVFTVTVPPSVPPPDAIDAVTPTFCWLTLLPETSRN